MSKIESKIGMIREKDELIYGFLSDFNNYQKLIPPDKVKDWESDTDHCSFTVDGLGHAGMQIIGKEAFKTIKISSDEKTMIPFTMWIQLKKMEEANTRVKITIEVKLNPVMLPMVKKPLQEFVDTLVDQMITIPYQDIV